jgi:hypothetical protein
MMLRMFLCVTEEETHSWFNLVVSALNNFAGEGNPVTLTDCKGITKSKKTSDTTLNTIFLFAAQSLVILSCLKEFLVPPDQLANPDAPAKCSCCDNGNEQNVLFYLMALHVIPLIVFDFLPSIPIRNVLLSLALAVFISLPVLIMSVHTKDYVEITSSCFQYMLIPILIYVLIIRRQQDRVQCFFYHKQLSQYLNEHQETAFYQKELLDMKHLIANVAHDLKTVSIYALFPYVNVD